MAVLRVGNAIHRHCTLQRVLLATAAITRRAEAVEVAATIKRKKAPRHLATGSPCLHGYGLPLPPEPPSFGLPPPLSLGLPPGSGLASPF